MREILFKAKRIDNAKWVEGFLTMRRHSTKDYKSPSELQYVIDHKDGLSLSLVDPATICQYTGLTDENGAKIFEDDIIEAGYYKWKCHVVWDEACARFICYTIEGERRIVYVDMCDKNGKSVVKVISNIHNKAGL